MREQIPLARLLNQVAQFPTYMEGWLEAFRALRLREPRIRLSDWMVNRPASQHGDLT